MAKTSLYLVTTDQEFLDAFYEDIKKARARGVTKLKLLIEMAAVEDKNFQTILEKYSKLCEIRSRDQIFGNSLVIDEGEDAFIILTQKFFQKQMAYFGIVTDHIAFGPASNYYFTYLWDSANQVDIE